MAKQTIPARRICSGSTVGIFSPSEPLTDDRLARVEKGIQILRTNGYSVRSAPHWRDSSQYMAGAPSVRISDIHALARDQDIDLLMTSWGGKSAAQLLPFLDYELLSNSKKPICAFSDGCVLLNAISTTTGLVTFYGPNVVGKLNESQFSDLAQLNYAGFQEGSKISFASKDTAVWNVGTAEGVLVGGNLSNYVISILGSRFEPSYSDCILFWESGEKSAQEMDMLLSALRVARSYDFIRGMIIGDAPVLGDSKWNTRALSEIVAQVFADRRFPILHGPIFGHRNLPNPIIPIGCRARLDAGRATLTLLESPVS